ncbi:uncharacterized protein SPPG_03493 [Spizellomyces punctatus DAOM BR117]|uniref:Coiled-coil SMC6 And NSE5 INteracting (CANIN) domain-containing protein n=1 Tax=Spizellomyces punctatus (strain DAOM BR117) TaxID=645134 RepID=A0A0L0HKX2_SPIPD|nr:uncharacterized protein SPPG_03493 [Spizellomyces punctatus DAOM BR117]KND01698.1 hypothetical protein SPPG_03493 [Spizellomyces punctatus DAOM BR117]|eukprot:XP_016609737.1 hypothetical protein SPPG_03493 [Spizellomyces punctatus DAOM BR117]
MQRNKKIRPNASKNMKPLTSYYEHIPPPKGNALITKYFSKCPSETPTESTVHHQSVDRTGNGNFQTLTGHTAATEQQCRGNNIVILTRTDELAENSSKRARRETVGIMDDGQQRVKNEDGSSSDPLAARYSVTGKEVATLEDESEMLTDGMALSPTIAIIPGVIASRVEVLPLSADVDNSETGRNQLVVEGPSVSNPSHRRLDERTSRHDRSKAADSFGETSLTLKNEVELGYATDPVIGRGNNDDDDDDEELLLPNSIHLETEQRRSSRAKRHVNYAPPPLDPFQDQNLFSHAHRTETNSSPGYRAGATAMKRKPMFSLDYLLKDKRKQENRRLEHERLLEQVVKDEDKSSALDLGVMSNRVLGQETGEIVNSMLSKPDGPEQEMSVAILQSVVMPTRTLQPLRTAVLPACLSESLTDKVKAATLLRGSVMSHLVHRKPDCAVVVLDWLFSTACYETDRQLADLACQNFTRIHNRTNSSGWILTINALGEMLRQFGCPPELLDDNARPCLGSFIKHRDVKVEAEGSSLQDVSFILAKIRILMTVLGICARQRPSLYSSNDLLNALHIVAILSTDSRVQLAYADTIGDTVADLCNALKINEGWPTLCGTVCIRLAEFAGSKSSHHVWVVSVFNWAASKSAAAREIRRQLARLLILRSEQCEDIPSPADVGITSLGTVWAKVSRYSVFSVAKYSTARDKEEYTELTALVKIFSLAVGNIDDLKDQSNIVADIATRLRCIFGSISDPRAAYLERTEAKHELMQLSAWMRLTASSALETETQTKLTFATSALSERS